MATRINGDALDVLEGAIGVAARARDAALHTVKWRWRRDQSNPLAAQEAARVIGASLDPLLTETLPTAFNLADDADAAIGMFSRVLMDHLADGQRMLDVIATLAFNDDPRSMDQAGDLLASEEKRIRGALALLTRFASPSARAGISAPPSKSGRKKGQDSYSGDARIVERIIRLCDEDGLTLPKAINQVVPEMEPLHLDDASKKKRIRPKVLALRPDLKP